MISILVAFFKVLNFFCGKVFANAIESGRDLNLNYFLLTHFSFWPPKNKQEGMRCDWNTSSLSHGFCTGSYFANFAQSSLSPRHWKTIQIPCIATPPAKMHWVRRLLGSFFRCSILLRLEISRRAHFSELELGIDTSVLSDENCWAYLGKK